VLPRHARELAAVLDAAERERALLVRDLVGPDAAPEREHRGGQVVVVAEGAGGLGAREALWSLLKHVAAYSTMDRANNRRVFLRKLDALVRREERAYDGITLDELTPDEEMSMNPSIS
jgi:hypothetical protein